jgi:phosphoribosylformylglycinamidine synthase
MTFIADIDVMPLKDLLDPQGKAVQHGLHNLKFEGVADVRIGKHVQITINASNETEATQIVNEACKKLLANPVMESYKFVLKAV